MGNNIGSGTALGLVEYLDKLVEKGRATPGAITPLKTAFVKVLEAVEGKDWHAVEVNAIDVDDYINRFAVLTSGTYTDSSISVYKSRINRVIEWYKKFQKQPGWMPQIKPKTPRSKSEKNSTPEESGTGVSSGAGDIDDQSVNNSVQTEKHEIAFNSGKKAVIILPIKRAGSDIVKLEKFIEYLKATSNLESDDGEDL